MLNFNPFALVDLTIFIIVLHFGFQGNQYKEKGAKKNKIKYKQITDKKSQGIFLYKLTSNYRLGNKISKYRHGSNCHFSSVPIISVGEF